MVWGILTLILGVAYGWLTPGRQNKMALLRMGLVVGFVVALVLAVLGYVLNADPLGFGISFIGLLFTVILLTLLFILGVWIGDLIEGATKRRTA